MAFKREEEESQLELISLIDVVFLLLAFFLVTSSLGRPQCTEGEMTVKIPELTQQEMGAHQRKVEVNLRIDIGMTRDGHIEYYVLHKRMPRARSPRVGTKPYNQLDYREWPRIRHTQWARRWDQPVSLVTVKRRIEDLTKLLMERQPPQRPIIAIQAEEGIPIEPVVEVMGLCKKLGLSEINLVLGDVKTSDEQE